MKTSNSIVFDLGNNFYQGFSAEEFAAESEHVELSTIEGCVTSTSVQPSGDADYQDFDGFAGATLSAQNRAS